MGPFFQKSKKSTSSVFVCFGPAANRREARCMGVYHKSLVKFDPAVIEKLDFLFFYTIKEESYGYVFFFPQSKNFSIPIFFFLYQKPNISGNHLIPQEKWFL